MVLQLLLRNVRKIFFTAVIIFSAQVRSQNLLTNGNFESGGNGVGFDISTTGYNQINTPFSGTTSPGNYAFVSNPYTMNTNYFIGVGDHTLGVTGKMLAIDGSVNTSQPRFWRAGNTGGGVCGLTVGATYTFSYWSRSIANNVIDASTQADIRVNFNNANNITMTSGSTLVPLPTFGWQQVSYTFTATAVCVNIELYNNNTNLAGNDFAVDDFSVTAQNACILKITNPTPVCTPGTLNLTLPAVTAGSTLNGGTLSYFTNAAGTIPLANPATVAVSGIYYIKTTNASGCSDIKPVIATINVTGTAAPVLFCDGANATPNSAAFDFNNIGQTSFAYTYSIDGGAPISGIWVAPSNLKINNLTPGQSVTLTLTWVGICVPPKTSTCSSTCPTTTNPNFAAISPICQNATAPVLSTISPNGVSGTWSPAAISTSAPGTTPYTFTPSTGCSSPQTLNVTVLPRITPTFNQIGPLCQNSTPPTLPTVSNNSPTTVSGTWNAPISTTSVGTTVYTFTPNGGQCTATTLTTMSITINAGGTPNFAPIAPICQNSPAPVLATMSPNGISGSWSPATISTTTPGTINYTFTPSGLCSSPQIINVTILPRITPTFTQIGPLCQNTTPPVLPNVSNNTPNTVSGMWNAPISTSTVGTTVYTFTPNAGQCTSVTPTTMSITVQPNVTPNFAAIGPLCAGSSPPSLLNTSPNGITGSWSPSVINVSAVGTNPYTFTPATGQCASNQILNIAITPFVHPSFSPTLTLCAATPPPALQNISPNGIAGSWMPAIIDNLASGSYVFTPNSGQCSEQHTLTVTVTPVLIPSFNTMMTLCQNATPPQLLNISPNGVNGTWSPAIINTNNLGVFNFTFTSTPGQCASVTHPLQVTIQANQTPDFSPILPFCEGDLASLLSNTSPNGVTGTWSPAIIDNNAIGTKPYIFTATPGQCAANQTLNITVNQKVVPTFTPIAAFCSGETAPVLPLLSNNGITGTWLPATVDNTTSADYFFQPDAPQCADVQTLRITVNQPIDPNFPDLTICAGSTPPALGPLSPNGISGSWLPVVIDNNVNAAYVFTPNTSECANPQTINVTVNQLTLNSVTWTVSNYFSNNPTVTVIANDPGNYVYQLDFVPFQQSNVFDHVALGTHTITVSDINGCSPSITENNVMVVGYPTYFTPNGDGFHDTWNLINLDSQTDATIFIFDRYGKLLKQIAPNGTGWDGTYNGNPMPSSDYWFTVNFSESGKSKQFAAHFSLKR